MFVNDDLWPHDSSKVCEVFARSLSLFLHIIL